MASQDEHEARMRKVVEYYLTMEKPNQAEAIRKGGGYSKRYYESPAKFFRRPEMQRMMESRQRELVSVAGVTTNDIVRRLKTIAMGDLSAFIKKDPDGNLYYDFTDATQEDFKLIAELQVEGTVRRTGLKVKKFKIIKHDALRALEQLNRMLGNFQDKMEVTERTSVERLQRGRTVVKDANRAKGRLLDLAPVMKAQAAVAAAEAAGAPGTVIRRLKRRLPKGGNTAEATETETETDTETEPDTWEEEDDDGAGE